MQIDREHQIIWIFIKFRENHFIFIKNILISWCPLIWIPIAAASSARTGSQGLMSASGHKSTTASFSNWISSLAPVVPKFRSRFAQHVDLIGTSTSMELSSTLIANLWKIKDYSILNTLKIDKLSNHFWGTHQIKLTTF